jgi:hypothetical protein
MPAGGELQDQGVEGRGKHDGLAAQSYPHLAVCDLDVVQGEVAERGRVLGVEEDKRASDTVLGFEAVVVEQPAGLVPAGLDVDDAGGPAPPDFREVQLGELLLACPADEVTGVGAVGRVRAGQLCLQVTLPGRGQGEGRGR